MPKNGCEMPAAQAWGILRFIGGSGFDVVAAHSNPYRSRLKMPGFLPLRFKTLEGELCVDLIHGAPLPLALA